MLCKSLHFFFDIHTKLVLSHKHNIVIIYSPEEIFSYPYWNKHHIVQRCFIIPTFKLNIIIKIIPIYCIKEYAAKITVVSVTKVDSINNNDNDCNIYHEILVCISKT